MSERSFVVKYQRREVKVAEANKEKGKRELASEARHKHLLEAAIACFVENGAARTSMRDIAGKAGVSIGNLYNHFPGRDDLIAEIAKMETAGLTDVLAQVAGCGTAQEAVETFVESYFAYCADPVSAVLTVEITSEALRNPAIEKLFSGNRSLLVNTLAAAIADCGQGKARSVETAGLALDAIEGFALRVGLAGKTPCKEDTEALLSFLRAATARQDV